MRSFVITLISFAPVACVNMPGRSPELAPFADAVAASDLDVRTPPKALEKIGESYTMAKLGAFLPSGDLDGLDDGLAAELVFGRELLPFLAIEGSIGYLDADGQFGPAQVELWAVPAFVQARASLPVLIFEPYIGVGLGGIYADYEVSGVASDDDFVFAWDAFIGLEVGLGRLAIGAEYKYLESEDTKDSFAIEGSTATLFLSLPF